MGDDKDFNTFVTEYVKLFELDPSDSANGSSGLSLDKVNLDTRVYLIPQGQNTLAHYIAMYDDLYCQNIYSYFNSNTLLRMTCTDQESGKMYPINFKVQMESLLGSRKNQLFAQMCDRSIQGYLHDAIRNFDLRIFKADLHLKGGKIETHYFTSRFEIGYSGVYGNSSAYEKLEAL